jgi:hypothetical protein
MITLNHTVNLVTEIDEFAMPSNLLNAFLSLTEKEMEQMLRGAFINALEVEGFLSKMNENNSWATLKVGNN